MCDMLPYLVYTIEKRHVYIYVFRVGITFICVKLILQIRMHDKFYQIFKIKFCEYVSSRSVERYCFSKSIVVDFDAV